MRPKNASTSGPKNRVAQLQEQTKSVSRASGSPFSSKTQVPPGEPAQVPVDEPASKRKRVEDVEGVLPKRDKVPARVFVLPPCYINCDLFSVESSLGIHEEEREAILFEDKEVR